MGEANQRQRCSHLLIHIDATANRLDGSNVVVASVAAQCKSCGTMFRFLGSYPMTPMIDQPSITPNGQRLLLPMVGAQEVPHLPAESPIIVGTA